MFILKSLNLIPFPPLIALLAYALDLAIGDPIKIPHPVRWIGRAIIFAEGFLTKRFPDTRKGRFHAGIFLVAVIALGTYFVCLALLYISYKYAFPVFFLLSTYIVWASISIRSLHKEAKAVLKCLNYGAIDDARKTLSGIVGRDTERLNEHGVLRATVETVAENTSDGVVAPLFYLIIGGPPLMLLYKAVNTLDSMVGYKNERYVDLGRASARLDDALNFIPARLTAALMACSAFLLGFNWIKAVKTIFRDGRRHPSPNAGYPEAAIAGALGIRLGGPSTYSGVARALPFINDCKDASPEINENHVLSTVQILHTTAAGMILITLLLRILAIFLL